MNLQKFCEMAGVTEEELHKIEKNLKELEQHVFYEDMYLKILVKKINKKCYRVLKRYSDVKNRAEALQNFFY